MKNFLKAMAKMFTGTDTLHDEWNVLQEAGEVQDVMKASNSRPQVVYKHSHRCSICIMAKERVEESMDAIGEKADMNFVNVVKTRPVSDAITDQTGVRHESPQILIIRNEEVIWHESHHAIKGDEMLKALGEAGD